MPIGFRVVLLPRLLSLFVEPVRSVSGCLLERTTMHARVHSERRVLIIYSDLKRGQRLGGGYG